MSMLEFMAAAVIAVYAMVGGAFINAAITAPENMRKLLISGWKSIIEFLLYGVAFLVCAVIVTAITWPNSDLSMNPFLWMSAAHLALFGAFYGCRRIVQIVLGHADGHHGGDKSQVGPDET